MVAIFKPSLQNLSPLPLAKPKTDLKFFVNTTKPKTKVFLGSSDIQNYLWWMKVPLLHFLLV